MTTTRQTATRLVTTVTFLAFGLTACSGAPGSPLASGTDAGPTTHPKPTSTTAAPLEPALSFEGAKAAMKVYDKANNAAIVLHHKRDPKGWLTVDTGPTLERDLYGTRALAAFNDYFGAAVKPEVNRPVVLRRSPQLVFSGPNGGSPEDALIITEISNLTTRELFGGAGDVLLEWFERRPSDGRWMLRDNVSFPRALMPKPAPQGTSFTVTADQAVGLKGALTDLTPLVGSGATGSLEVAPDVKANRAKIVENLKVKGQPAYAKVTLTCRLYESGATPEAPGRSATSVPVKEGLLMFASLKCERKSYPRPGLKMELDAEVGPGMGGPVQPPGSVLTEPILVSVAAILPDRGKVRVLGLDASHGTFDDPVQTIRQSAPN